MKLAITADSTFTIDIDFTHTSSGRSIGFYVQRDESGYTCIGRDDIRYLIGHRKTWQKALHDALVWAEQQTADAAVRPDPKG